MQKLLLTLACIGVPAVAGAQVVRGTVVGETDRPVPGIVVALVDSTAREIRRALTDATGEYRLVAPRPGTYRLRTLRIGYRSILTEPIQLAVGADISRRLAVSTVPVALDTVRATGRNACTVVAADSTSLVAGIWEQARGALLATQLSFAGNLLYTSSLNFQRTLGARSQKVGGQSSNTKTEFARQPWSSLSPDSLRALGYVFTTPQNTRMYYAPDLATLLSETFVEDHCFRIARASTGDRLGIEFEPTPARRGVTDIRGTLWLDRKTNALNEIEYTYANGISADEERLAGGEVEFAPMQNGMWTISRWSIRMPVPVVVPVRTASFSVSRYETRLDSVRITGGELLMATTTGTRRDTIWMRAPTMQVAAAEPSAPVNSDAPAPRATPLDTVRTSTNASGDPALSEFENRRRRGIGRFITRAQIAEHESGATSALLQGLPGVRILSAQGGEWAYNASQRCQSLEALPAGAGSSNGTTCSLFYQPSREEARAGVTSRCYAKVYVDHALMNPGIPTPPYDLRNITPSSIEAIEYYAHASEVPVEFRNLNSDCGLVIFHTRRRR